MQVLNLPTYSFRIKEENHEKYIYDVIRSKFILLTKEEWVRQHILHYLITDLGYPKGLIKVESGVDYNKRLKRSDIVVYNNSGNADILVECKSPETPINQSTMEQAAMYNKTLKARFIVLTNGMIHYTFSFDLNGKLVNLQSIPVYNREQ